MLAQLWSLDYATRIAELSCAILRSTLFDRSLRLCYGHQRERHRAWEQVLCEPITFCEVILLSTNQGDSPSSSPFRLWLT